MKRMNSMQIGILLLFCLAGNQMQINARIMSRCDIAKELKKNNFPMTFISNWVCLVESESGGDTAKVVKTPLYDTCGIFQISSKEWCGRGFVGGTCKIKCDDLLTDKIDADIKCAKKIYERHGFKWWKGWESKCKLKPLPNVSNCFSGSITP